MGASTAWTLSGINDRDRLISGALSLLSDTNMVLSTEQTDAVNPYDKGSMKYYVTELKNRPVVLSSMLNMSSDIWASTKGGYNWLVKKEEANHCIAGIFLLAANVTQAVLVNKNDYNIEASSHVPSSLPEMTDQAKRKESQMLG